MKLLAVACLAAVATIDATPAAACSPPPPCGDQYCFAFSGEPPDAIVEGVLVDLSGSGAATVDVTAVAGASELPLGEATLSLDPSAVLVNDFIGETVLLYVRRAPDGELFITQRIRREGLDECFASNEIAVADLAAVVMSAQCRDTLNADTPPFEGCGDLDGPVGTGCSASGGSAGALAALAFALVGVPLRRRRR